MKTIKDKEVLLREIERYFDCLLSDEEEAALRRELSRISISHPAVDEAKALMGFHTIPASVMPSGKKDYGFKRKTVIKIVQGVAASLLIVLAGVGIFSVVDTDKYDGECLAYVNGKFITDDNAVMDILMENVAELDEGLTTAQEDLLNEMEEFIPIADRLDSDFGPEDI